MRLLTFALAASVSAGCIEYNPECAALVENPDQEIGYLGEVVRLDRPYTRHANNAIGQLVAEAFLHALDDSAAPAELGIENGGGIRMEGVCITRDRLQPGPIKRGVLHEILPFDNLVVAIDVTEPELVAMMEHSVEGLSPSGTVITNPPGFFLHIAGGTVTVDCARSAGARVTAMTVGSRTVSIPGDSAKKYRVAMTSFIAQGNDAFTMLTGAENDPARNPARATKAGGTDARITAQWFEENYTEANPLVSDKTRITFVNCASP